ncbi:MAG: DNA-directed RNA polymerase subunit H [Nanoarchaeota archaeon]|nr:DNA-directed RNA polymerase subunit H [Nanoarchaeota archaeon]MBU4299948.1 DNA-directed RNA polymerase subunit H [Nanoarchaeota archaeon]MBU4452247.1 DNA-directed RNA polymerase subunit H [Nanoarchaeota archaeon]MCG2723674.1 DNA-directed RNA polymerase subunit H [archaeon]
MIHFLVPKQEILSPDSIAELLEKMKIKVENLPKIGINDPAIQHLNPKLGDVIKITRKSATAGTSYYYRMVIESNIIISDESETE